MKASPSFSIFSLRKPTATRPVFQDLKDFCSSSLSVFALVSLEFNSEWVGKRSRVSVSVKVVSSVSSSFFYNWFLENGSTCSLLCGSQPSLCFGVIVFFNTSICYDSNYKWSVILTVSNYICEDFQGWDQYLHRLVAFSKSSYSWNCQKATMEIQNTGIHWPLNTLFTKGKHLLEPWAMPGRARGAGSPSIGRRKEEFQVLSILSS